VFPQDIVFVLKRAPSLGFVVIVVEPDRLPNQVKAVEVVQTLCFYNEAATLAGLALHHARVEAEARDVVQIVLRDHNHADYNPVSQMLTW